MAHPSDEIGPPVRPRPNYAPGVLIVKLKEPVADQLKAALVRGEPLHQVSLTPSLDALNTKCALKDMRLLFRSFQVKDEVGRVVGVETMAEHFRRASDQFPARAARGALEYRGPDLTTFFKLRTERGADIEAAAAEYGRDPDVEYAGPDYEAKVAWQPNDHFYNTPIPGSWGQPYSDLWGIKKIRCGEGWDYSKGSGVTVAVIDSGTWYRYCTGQPPGVENYDGHLDLKPNLWINYYEYYGRPGYDDDGNGYIDDKYGYNFVDNPEDPEDSVGSDPMDFNGHGTHVGGTIAAVGNNVNGVIGVAPQARVMTVKALSRGGWGYNSWIADGIEYAASNGADVFNLSLGGPGKPFDVVSAIEYAYSLGCVIVVAAGNDSLNATWHCPANLARTITVSATDYQDSPASFTNYGTVVDVAAPGCDILSTRSASDTHSQSLWIDDPEDPGDLKMYLRLNGTSMSAPHVAGTAALVLSVNPSLNPEEVRTCLRKSAVDLGEYGFDEFYGFGRTDAMGAVQRAYTASYACQALIMEPEDGEVFVRDEGAGVDVYGIADSDYWDYYPYCWDVYYKPKYGSSAWNYLSSGYNRAPWYYGTHMGTISFDNVPDGSVSIRLTVYGYYGEAFCDYKTVVVCTSRHYIYYDPPDLPNWVKPGVPHSACGCPLIADLTTAYSGKEIFIGTEGRYVYDFLDGEWTEVWRPGFYRAVRSDGNALWEDVCNDYSSQEPTHYGTFAPPTGAELNSYYPLEEVVLPTEKGFEPPETLKTLRMFSAGGQQVWERLMSAHYYAWGSAASVADLESGYAGQEVVVAHGGNVSCLTGDLSLVIWSVPVSGSQALAFSSPVIANMDGQSDLEIAVGTHGDSPSDKVRVLKRIGGSWQIYRTFTVGNAVRSSPAAADLFSQWPDPKGVVKQTPGCEIVVGTSNATNPGKVYCLSASALLTCWTYTPGAGSAVISSPAIADLDGDADLEIVVGCDIWGGGGKVLCLHHDGTLKWELQTLWHFSRSSPAIADLDPAHPGLEVAIMDLAGRLYILHGDDGTVQWCVDIPGYCSVWPNYSPAVGDVRPDAPGLEIVAAMQDDYLYIFNIAGTQSGIVPWPMFHHDARHTGYAP
ncbi:MAG: S8 family serine peptidase [bacterium]|nr:S8 family serine peptidase [bacterium]